MSQMMIISGLLTKKPELKTTQNNKMMCIFTVACNDGYGQYKRTDYFNCVAYGKTAEAIEKHFDKGSGIYLTGKMQNNPFRKNNAGYDEQNWQFLVEKMEFPLKSSSTNNAVSQSSPVAGFEVVSSPAEAYQTPDDDMPF